MGANRGHRRIRTHSPNADTAQVCDWSPSLYTIPLTALVLLPPAGFLQTPSTPHLLCRFSDHVSSFCVHQSQPEGC